MPGGMQIAPDMGLEVQLTSAVSAHDAEWGAYSADTLHSLKVGHLKSRTRPHIWKVTRKNKGMERIQRNPFMWCSISVPRILNGTQFLPILSCFSSSSNCLARTIACAKMLVSLPDKLDAPRSERGPLPTLSDLIRSITWPFCTWNQDMTWHDMTWHASQLYRISNNQSCVIPDKDSEWSQYWALYLEDIP